MKKTLFALAFAAAALPAAASQVVPAEPIAFELVELSLATDACNFEPSSVRVRAVGSTLQVTQAPGTCSPPGAPISPRIRLGALAAGQYTVEVYYGSAVANGTPYETLRFEVRERAEIAVFPPPTRPLTDYTGLWWNPQESGWGLSLRQTATDIVFGALFVYGAARDPEWFTLQSGTWETSTKWRGRVYRTTGPSYTAPVFDPNTVTLESVGEATLDFDRPGPADEPDVTYFTYSVNGVTYSKMLKRML
jgi:hypothetical protein